jgi:hypothetical protein
MAKFIPGTYLDGKIEIEFDQGDERDQYRNEHPDAVDPKDSGYCTTAALYWIKTHQRLRSTALEDSHKGMRGKTLREAVQKELSGQRETLFSLHDAANAALDQTKSALATAKEQLERRQAKILEAQREFQSGLAELRAKTQAMQEAKNHCNMVLEERDREREREAFLAKKAELLRLNDKIKTRLAKQDELKRGAEEEAADANLRIGNTEIEGVYSSVAQQFQLRFASGAQKEFDPGTIGADVKGLLLPGGYYVLNFREENGEGHTMAAFVSPINGNKGGKLHLFDPNLGTYKCSVEQEGANLIREISKAYKQDDEKTFLYSEVRVFQITLE